MPHIFSCTKVSFGTSATWSTFQKKAFMKILIYFLLTSLSRESLCLEFAHFSSFQYRRSFLGICSLFRDLASLFSLLLSFWNFAQFVEFYLAFGILLNFEDFTWLFG